MYNVNWKRVIPRDLFNEAKLLKCAGRLSLMIHDGKIDSKIELTGSLLEGDAPLIALRDDGNLIMVNLRLFFKNRSYELITTYNSKSNYPLFVEDNGYNQYLVFDEDGFLSIEFKEFFKID